MFWSKKNKEKKENEIRLRKLHRRELRYITVRDGITYNQSVIGKNGIITIVDDVLSITCGNKVIFSHALEGLIGSELMSLDGVILTYNDESTGEEVEVIAHYKYYRK